MSKFYDWGDDDDAWDYKPYTSSTYTPARRERSSWWKDSSVKETLEPKPRKSLSGFWSDRWKSWESNSDLKWGRIRALDSVRRVGSIVFGAKKSMPFTWHAHTGDGTGVVLDDAPISSKNVSWDMDKRVDAVMGGALAESARNLAEKLVVYSDEVASEVSATSRWLTGVAGVTQEFPGYHGYFTTNRDFFHNPKKRAEVIAGNAPYLMQEPRSRAAALSAIVWNALRPEEPLDTSPELEPLTRRLGEELRKAHTLSSRTARASALQGIIRQIRELPESEQEQEDRARGTKDSPSAEMGVSESRTVGKQTLDKADAMRLEAAVHEEEQQEQNLDQKFPKLNSKYSGADIKVVSKQAEAASAGAYQRVRSQIQPLIARTRAALSFRNEIAKMNELGLRSGLLDESALASVALGSDRVFRRQEVISAPSVHLGLLVDESGSMHGIGETTARQCSVLIREAVHNLPGIAFSVWGHTANIHPCMEGVVVRRYIERNAGDHERLANLQGRCENIDGGAILYAGKRMMDLSRAGEHRILFVLCDGYPHGTVRDASTYGAGYYGSGAILHMRNVVDGLRSGGVQVFALGMGRGVTNDYLRDAFGEGNWVLCAHAADTPQAVASLLKKSLKTGSAR